MRRAALVLTGALVLTAAGAGTAHAQGGALDPRFGAAGLAQTPFGTGARAAALALGPAGSVTIAGDVRGSGGERTLVARFTATGALDPTFNAGRVRLDRFGGAGVAAQRGRAVVVGPDGATTVAGIAGDQIMVARYRPDGGLDGRFGAGGIVLRDLSGAAGMPPGTGLAAIALTASGQVLVAGSVGVPAGDAYDESEPGERVVVGRLTSRGLPDPSFGSAGFALLQLGARSARRPARSRASALALLPDGRIVVAGAASSTDGSERAVVARVTAAGRLDPAYARGGRALVQLGLRSAARAAGSQLHALLLAADGSLLAGGAGTDVAGFRQALLARFTAGGRIDGRFGRRGVVRAQVGSGTPQRRPQSVVRALAPAADGALVAGSDDAGGAFTSRVAPSGRLDCGYGVRGVAAVRSGSAAASPSFDGAFAGASQPDGAFVIAGRRAGGGVLLGRVLGGLGVQPAVVARPELLTLGPRYAGKRRGFAYGVVDARCGGAVGVRFVATPLRGGRTISTRVARVSGVYGREVVCAVLEGLVPGRRYGVRIESGPPRVARGATLVLRAAAGGGRRVLAQEGCV